MSRPDPFALAPRLIQGLIDYGQQVTTMGLEPSLMKLVKIRASQINGCAVCLDMHAREAMSAGETIERIILLDAWRESPAFTPRERAALAWTEALTDLAGQPVPDAAYQPLADQFSGEEQVALTLLIGVINSFNRLGAGFLRAPLTQHRAAA
ncbi:MAG: carboxymuconolactone decarboxylase family protein [Caulobacteraceae bacterium]|nr:carboxymuconolactone decarboxylase family protein [Caulobacteraceae bacterium]